MSGAWLFPPSLAPLAFPPSLASLFCRISDPDWLSPGWSEGGDGTGRWYPGWGRGCCSAQGSQRKPRSRCDPPRQNQNALRSNASAVLGFAGISEGCWRGRNPRASLRRPGETEARRGKGRHQFWGDACGAGGPSLLPSPAL